MTHQEATKIANEAAQRVADFWIASSSFEEYTSRDRIDFLHEVASETSESGLMVAVLQHKVRLLVSEELYRSVYPLPIVK